MTLKEALKKKRKKRKKVNEFNLTQEKSLLTKFSCRKLSVDLSLFIRFMARRKNLNDTQALNE